MANKLKESTNLKMVISAHYIPKYNPASPDGEDVHFFCEKAGLIGVADGVGGWTKQGVDVGQYARHLMKRVASAYRRQVGVLNPKKVLEEAYSKTKALGSSTACIISLVGNCLRAVNLGDSGFIVIRKGKTVFKSKVQRHRFNFPYRLGTGSKDGPEKAEEMEVEVRREDVVVAGTDGLFDNLFTEDVERVVNYCFEIQTTIDVMVQVLAEMARRSSLDGKKITPFADAAVDAGIEYFDGKYDDITVVGAFVI